MTPNDPARTRFFILSALRLGAACLIAAGIVIGFGDRQWVSEGLKAPLGLALIGVGLVDLVVVIPMLTRRWRSGP